MTEWVNPFLGTEPLTDTSLIGYAPPKGWRVWAGLTYPGAALPNAMVQLSPVTEFGTRTGYQYEDSVIKAFTHTNKGHWNLCHIPVLPVTGEVTDDEPGSRFSHETETASPDYYQVLLQDYGINAEFTVTRRTGFHRYTFPGEQTKKLLSTFPVLMSVYATGILNRLKTVLSPVTRIRARKCIFTPLLTRTLHIFEQVLKKDNPCRL